MRSISSTGVVLDLAPGDIAIFGGFTPHRSAPNRSTAVAAAALPELQRAERRRRAARRHYAEFHGWLKDRYAEYGKTATFFR